MRDNVRCAPRVWTLLIDGLHHFHHHSMTTGTTFRDPLLSEGCPGSLLAD